MVYMLIVLTLTALAWSAHNDRRVYARFIVESDSVARRRFYRFWTTTSFIGFGLGALVILVLIGRLGSVLHFPSEFAAMHAAMPAEPSYTNGDRDTVLGLIIGGTLGLSVAALIWRRRLQKMRQPVIGNIEPLLPRNRAEVLTAIPLAINAGVSEELFFRLALPLLLVAGGVSPLVALIAASLIFGLMHWYQGWKGMVAVTVVGLFLAFMYIKSGSLVRPIVVHVIIDLFGLVIRPAVSLHLNRNKTFKSEGLAHG